MHKVRRGVRFGMTSNAQSPLQDRLHEVLFESDTPSGAVFDVALLVAILLSVFAVMLESVESIQARYTDAFFVIEWIFTVLFTLEYALRLFAVRKPFRYATSFFGVVDLLSILPTYLTLFFPGTQSLLVVRALRLLRVFRVLKLGRLLDAADALRFALWSSKAKITVFLCAVTVVVVLMGSAMYLVEGPEHGFTSIPIGMYWAIVTMTTVGYGDLVPVTVLGKILASVVIFSGYALIVVPAGIVTGELVDSKRSGRVSTQACPECSLDGHDYDAKHCKYCGSQL